MKVIALFGAVIAILGLSLVLGIAGLFLLII